MHQVSGCSTMSVFVQLSHAAYSPDVAPNDYFLFRNLKF